MTLDVSQNDEEYRALRANLAARVPRPPPPSATKLSPVIRETVDHLLRFPSAHRPEVFAQVADRLDALNARPEGTRMEILVELIALTATKVQELEATADRALTEGDPAHIEVAHRALDRAANRLVLYLREHRIECQFTQRRVGISHGGEGVSVRVMTGG